jgi:hypothetical protein
MSLPRTPMDPTVPETVEEFVMGRTSAAVARI